MSEGPILLRVDPERIGASGVRTVLDRCFDPDHRSLSGDRAFDECQFRAHAIATGTPQRFGIDAAVGSAVHAAVAADLLGEPVSIPGLLAAYAAEWSTGSIPDRDREKAERLFALWQEEVRPEWLAVGVYAVEWELHFDLGGAIYHVHPDVVLTDGSVFDLKTSEKRLAAERVTRDPQLTTYAYGVWRVFEHLPPAVGLDGLIFANPPTDVAATRPGTKKPWWDRQRGTRTVEQYRTFEDEVARREAARRFARTTGVYQTQGLNGPEYVCKRCEARAICPAWRGYEWLGQQQTGSEAHAA